MNKKIKLKSKVMLEMTMLDFESGLNLFSTISKELLKIDIDLGKLDLGNIGNADLDKSFINTLKNTILSLVVSQDVRECLYKVFERCLYNNKKIDINTFEEVQTRADYFVVCWEVLRFNLSPFLPKIDLSLLVPSQTTSNIQK